MTELAFGDQHLRHLVRQRLEKEFSTCKYTAKGEELLIEKPKGGKVSITVTKDGFKISPQAKKKSFWVLALVIAFIIQILAYGITGLPKYFTMIGAFALILMTISLVSSFTSTYTRNKYFAERIEEYLKKDMLSMG